jgi:hypothetical protein
MSIERKSAAVNVKPVARKYIQRRSQGLVKSLRKFELVDAKPVPF